MARKMPLPAAIEAACEPFPSIDEADLDPLLARIGDSRIVLLGEATHGTSTQQSAGRLSISRPSAQRLGTLPLNLNGAPPSHARMMSAPYSWLRSTSSGRSQSPCASRRRRTYSSSGMLKRSISSGRSALMNHGTYSAKCSEDSVTKRPSQRITS